MLHLWLVASVPQDLALHRLLLFTRIRAPMNRRLTALAALFCAAAALSAAPAAAQSDTTAAAATPATTPAAPAPAEAQQSVEDAAARVPRARRSLNLISYEEVRSSNASNAFELVRSLRPSWLRTPRGPNSFSAPLDVAVFKDGTRLGNRTALSAIPTSMVRTMRFYTASDARQKFGGATSAGAIEISSQ
jgi:hypothetical protein